MISTTINYSHNTAIKGTHGVKYYSPNNEFSINKTSNTKSNKLF